MTEVSQTNDRLAVTENGDRLEIIVRGQWTVSGKFTIAIPAVMLAIGLLFLTASISAGENVPFFVAFVLIGAIITVLNVERGKPQAERILFGAGHLSSSGGCRPAGARHSLPTDAIIDFTIRPTGFGDLVLLGNAANPPGQMLLFAVARGDFADLTERRADPSRGGGTLRPPLPALKPGAPRQLVLALQASGEDQERIRQLLISHLAKLRGEAGNGGPTQ